MPSRERARMLAYLPQSGRAEWEIDVETLVSLGRLPHRGRWGGLSAADRAAIEQALCVMEVTRSEERRVGKQCVSTCRSRWSTVPSQKNKTNKQKRNATNR